MSNKEKPGRLWLSWCQDRETDSSQNTTQRLTASNNRSVYTPHRQTDTHSCQWPQQTHVLYSQLRAFCDSNTNTYDLLTYYHRHHYHLIHRLLTFCHSVRKFSDSTAVRSHWSRPHNKYSPQYLYWNRPSTIKLFSKNRINRVLELELEHTNNDCRCSNETITITITDKNYNYSNNYEIFIITDYISVYADHAIDKQISSKQ